jgi:hypothetical protein
MERLKAEVLLAGLAKAARVVLVLTGWCPFHDLTWLKIVGLDGVRLADLGFRRSCGVNVRTNGPLVRDGGTCRLEAGPHCVEVDLLGSVMLAGPC